MPEAGIGIGDPSADRLVASEHVEEIENSRPELARNLRSEHLGSLGHRIHIGEWRTPELTQPGICLGDLTLGELAGSQQQICNHPADP